MPVLEAEILVKRFQDTVLNPAIAGGVQHQAVAQLNSMAYGVSVRCRIGVPRYAAC